MDTHILKNIEETQKALETTYFQRFLELDAALKATSPQPHSTISSLSKDVSCFKEQVSALLNLLRQQIQSVSSMVDTIEMRHRKKFLVFNGMQEVEGEDIAASLVSLCRDKLQLPDVSKDAIVVCYRLGAPSADRSRAVLARFGDYRLRNSVWMAKKALKGSQVTITEFLTKQRQSQFIEARKHFGIRRVWTMEGNIYIKLPNGNKERLSSDIQLQTLKSQFAAVAPAPKVKSSTVTRQPQAPTPVAAPHTATTKTAPVVAGIAKDPPAGPSRKGDEKRVRRLT